MFGGENVVGWKFKDVQESRGRAAGRQPSDKRPRLKPPTHRHKPDPTLSSVGESHAGLRLMTCRCCRCRCRAARP